MSFSSTISFDFDKKGLNELSDKIRSMSDHRSKRREIIKLLRRQAKPLVPALKNEAPVAKKTVKYHRDRSIEYKPGNLGKSIKIFTGRNKDYPNVQVGPQAKKPKGSGYYSYFIQYGTRGRNGIFRVNNYVERVDKRTRGTLGNEASEELSKYLERQFKKMGFKTV